MATTPRSSIAPLIPEEHANEIIQALPAQSAVLTLPNVRRRTASRNQVRVPVTDVLPEAYWVEEGNAKAETTGSWANKFLNIGELAVIARVHENVLEDSEYDVWEELQPTLVEAIGRRVDQAVLFGTGTPPASFPDSIVEGALATGNAVTAGVGEDFAEDVNLAFAEVEQDGYGVNGAVARLVVKSRLRGLRDQDGQPIFSTSLQNDGNVGSVYGEPLAFSQNGSWDASAADMIVGDWSNLMFAIRRDISIKISGDATVGGESTFERDEIAMRITFRCGFLVLNPPNRENPDEETRFPFAVIAPESPS